MCYFLSVGTSAGVWTSVALCNSIYVGRLTDWHSIYFGKTELTEQPGFKMYLPGTQTIMVIATLDRSTPRQAGLRPGLMLNLVGLLAAVCGAIFQSQTRDALKFGPFVPTPAWVVYTSAGICLATALLITEMLIVQFLHEHTWSHDAEMATRWAAYSTVPSALVVAGLGIWFARTDMAHLWPILDALTWVSGLPLGMVENGMLPPMDGNTIHLILINRWMMGAVASAVGSLTT